MYVGVNKAVAETGIASDGLYNGVNVAKNVVDLDA